MELGVRIQFKIRLPLSTLKLQEVLLQMLAEFPRD